jgi:phospholipase/lecithinase/hemolysin
MGTQSASGGCGYVQRGPEGVVFLDLVNARRELDYDLIVFFGSRNDTLQKGDVRAAAAEAYNAARRNSPDAELLVIGPPWVADDPPDWIQGTRDAVAAAAADAGATFVDPLAEGWFTGEASRYIGTDNIQPTDEGHHYMAGLIVPHLEQAIDGLPGR